MSVTGRAAARVDVAVGLALMIVTAGYLIRQPHNLGIVDESVFLYEATRLADGEVMYRDVFDLITPLSLYFTALVFRVFGADMGVARATIACIHAVTVLAIYLCTRRVGVHATLAAACALAYVPLAQITWPFVSQHWFATMTTMLVLLSLLTCRWHERPSSMMVPGLLIGLVIGVQQQKGLPHALMVGALLVANWLLARRHLPTAPVRVLRQQLAYFAAGGALVLVPLFAVLAARAGIERLVEALIVFPLANYHNRYGTTWGSTQFLNSHDARMTFPLVLGLAPLVLVPLVVRLARLAWRVDLQAIRPLLTLLLFGVASIASIIYYPDIIHLAFIAPAFIVVAAETTESMLRALFPARPATLIAGVIGVLLLGGCAWRMHVNLQDLRRTFASPYDTAFGRIDFPDASLFPVIEKARELLDAAPVKFMFTYPSAAGPYLWLDAHNPTRFQYFAPGYNDRGQVEEVIATLEATRTPVVLTLPLMARQDDPIVQYVVSKYDYVGLGFIPKMFLYRRRPEPAAAVP